MTKAGHGLQDFLTLVRSENLARSNRFEVMIQAPQMLADHTTSMGDSVRVTSMLAEDVIFPGLLIGTRMLKLNNILAPRATAIDFGGDSITVTFLCDNAWAAKDFFGDWMRLIVDPVTREIRWPEEYYGGMDIVALNEQDEITAHWRLFDIFPRSIAPIQASATNAQVLRMPVTFTYAKWQVMGGYRPDGSQISYDQPSDIDREEPVDYSDGNDSDLEQQFDEEFDI